VFRTIGILILLVAAAASSVAAQVLSVTDFGAAGDGKTGDTAAFQKALDEAGKAPGTRVSVPIGNFLIAGSLRIPAGVTLEGVWQSPTAFMHNTGTILLVTGGAGNENGTPFITMATNSTLKGVAIFYPEQRRDKAPPIAYPWTIRGGPGDNISVIDVLAVNPYRLLDLTGAGRHYVRGLYGQPLRLGIRVDECYDVGRIENCHLWPFYTGWLNEFKELNDWMLQNAVAFEFARTDWQYVHNTFCFGYAVGYRFTQSKAGPCNGNFLGIGADCCRRPVLVEATQPGGLLITNAELVGAWGTTDSVGIEVLPGARGKISLTNSTFWGPLDRCVWVRSDDAWFTANAVDFGRFDIGAVTSPAVQADGGRLILTGNTFGEGSVHVLVGEKVRSAILTANQAAGGLMVDNRAGAKTQMVANEQPDVVLSGRDLEHYRVQVGAEGDQRFVRRFHGRERMPSTFAHQTMRWSRDRSTLALPVVSGKRYALTLQVMVPESALEPEAGIYLGDQRLAGISKSGEQTLQVVIPPQKRDTVVLTLRCRGWIPRDTLPGSSDQRMLGIALYTITLRAAGTSGTPVSATVPR
jgi:hypothetical protein